jgi:TonB family protein
MARRLLLVYLITFAATPLVCAQYTSPSVALPQAIYSPKPIYRPEWAKQGLAGKGVVLVTIDPKTGSVAGVRMLQSTGNKLLDGAALQAYSQWRFKPGSVSQVKMPIEFSSRSKGQTSAQRSQPPRTLIYPLILIAVVAVFITILKRRRG